MVGILVVSDVRFYCEGLNSALSAEPGFEVVGTAADPAAALAVVRAGPVEVALVDLDLTTGLPLVRAIHQVAPAVRIVAIGLPETGPAVVPWAEAGVAGYVSKGSSLRQLIAVVDAISRGDSPCAPQVSAALFVRLATVSGHARTDQVTAQLTARELEIATMLARGLTNREIARALTIALPTVKNHVHNVLEKLRLHRRADIAAHIGSGMSGFSTARPPPPG